MLKALGVEAHLHIEHKLSVAFEPSWPFRESLRHGDIWQSWRMRGGTLSHIQIREHKCFRARSLGGL